jgi:mono/diheme cytochrome c family protein
MTERRVGRRLGVSLFAVVLALAFSAPGFAATNPGNTKAGKKIFTQFCGSCHKLKDAKTVGTVGPNLDKGKRTYAKIVITVTKGKGAMTSYSYLGKKKIQDVAAYVFKKKV